MFTSYGRWSGGRHQVLVLYGQINLGVSPLVYRPLLFLLRHFPFILLSFSLFFLLFLPFSCPWSSFRGWLPSSGTIWPGKLLVPSLLFGAHCSLLRILLLLSFLPFFPAFPFPSFCWLFPFLSSSCLTRFYLVFSSHPIFQYSNRRWTRFPFLHITTCGMCFLVYILWGCIDQRISLHADVFFVFFSPLHDFHVVLSTGPLRQFQ